MTPKSLFNIILKVFGLFFLRNLVLIVPQFILSLSFFIPSGNSDWVGTEIATVIFIAFAMAFYALAIYLLLFKTNEIVDKLKLAEGFDQKEFSCDVSASQIFTLALVIIGSVILIEEIPDFIDQAVAFFQKRKLLLGTMESNSRYIIISAVKIVLGLLIIGERKRIVMWADRNGQKRREKK